MLVQAWTLLFLCRDKRAQKRPAVAGLYWLQYELTLIGFECFVVHTHDGTA